MEVRTMNRERSQTPFDVEKMVHLLDGGADRTRSRREAVEVYCSNPVFNDGMQRYDMSTEEARISTTKKMFLLADMTRTYSPEFIATLCGVSELSDPSFSIRFFVQRTLWTGTITQQGTPEQRQKWLDGAMEMKIIGCFAMTELGHSSHLRGAETTATYDVAAQEFVINTPTLTATKWWIGQAGQIATHAIVFANAFSLGKALGIQLFVVPVRDARTGYAMPGVEIGDIGPKYGRHGNDNGYIRFSNVRIKRENMLARFAQVDQDGTFHPPLSPALAYGSTIAERVGSVRGGAAYSMLALTSAVRFGVIRRQGEGTPEPQIMDYQSHYITLMPMVARVYANLFASHKLSARYAAMLESLEQGDIQGFVGPIADVHAVSCAGKSIFGWMCTETLEACRRSMGGHGYHQYSLIPRLIADFGVTTTGGGDNNVIIQQCSRYLVKTYGDVRKKGAAAIADPTSSIAHLARCQQILSAYAPPHVTSWEDLRDLDVLSNVLEFAAVSSLEGASTAMWKDISDGATKKEAMNEHMMALNQVAELHIILYSARAFRETLESQDDAAIRKTLSTLCALFILTQLNKHAAALVQTSVLRVDSLKHVQRAVRELSKETRQYCIGLTDAFDLDDRLMNAPLAMSDGDLYEHYFTAMKNNRINKAKAPYWDELVAPRVRDQSQLHSRL